MKERKTNCVLKNLSPKDFLCTFESQGSTFLFEDIVARYYMSSESVIFSDGKKMPVFVANKSLEKMREKANLRTVADTQQAISSLSVFVDKALELAASFRNKSSLTLDEVNATFFVLGSICKNYEYFEPYYWDGVFEQAQNDPEKAKNVRLVQESKNVVRARLDPIFYEGTGLLSVLVSIISRQFSISPEDLVCYGEVDIKNLFRRGRLTSENILNRKSGYVLYINESSDVCLFEGDEAISLYSKFVVKPSMLEGVSIRGMIANGKGKVVRGIVRILSRNYADPGETKNKIVQMQKGDIFVSETTDPEMIAGLKKAGAIVTDVGGMLSHAAITARELDIPCIVATQIATKVLKDGDMVEVDADKGVVRII